jgi:hypothetical protein
MKKLLSLLAIGFSLLSFGADSVVDDVGIDVEDKIELVCSVDPVNVFIINDIANELDVVITINHFLESPSDLMINFSEVCYTQNLSDGVIDENCYIRIINSNNKYPNRLLTNYNYHRYSHFNYWSSNYLS